ncbi:acyl-CoA N-acyltransferase [Hypoxylon sp. FL1150]|nr:acyl-CoA N-acyltransferase [Hypoxylon sp. FL1150]
MATLKRKRLSDHESAPQPRRATRQHPAPEEHQLRSGRVRAHTIEKPTIPHVESVDGRRRRSDASRTTKTTRNAATDTDATATATIKGRSKENIEPQESGTKEQVKTSKPSVEANASSIATTTARITTGSPPPQTRLVPPSRKSSLQQTLRPPHPTSTEKTTTPKRPIQSPSKPLIAPGTPRSDRNIDKVVLGNICFRAWYPSYYGKEVLGDASGNNGAKDNRDSGGGKIGRIGGGKRAGLPPPVLDRLYVCPCCFKYSKELVTWWEHVRCCERTFVMPGRKVYTHPKGARGVRRVAIGSGVGADADEKEKGKRGRGRKKSDTAAAAESATNGVMKDEGEWSVWEVDGEKDRLFCQNLSLFAKLFLDNKSVFFDVTGFNYFLLVYTPPPSNAQPPPSLASNPPQPPASTIDTEPSHQLPDTSPPDEPWSRPQVVGFFSKEKLSWDSNNLACILVFPPWQRKGLGALLMGVSYEISRREDILGGPEKPISELGRKGYKRYWAGEIARWLLEHDVSESESESESEPVDGEEEGETLISIEQCSRATWIVPEDCLAVLREMGVIEDAGLGPAEMMAAADTERRSTSGSAADVDADSETEVQMVSRVRVDKAAVRRWVVEHKIDLTRACDPEGFVEGYAIRGSESEETDEA